MQRISISFSIGWQTPIWPDWKDKRLGAMSTRRNFYRWLISAGIDMGGGPGTLLSLGFMGFYVTLCLPV